MQVSMSEELSVCKIITYLELLLMFTSESITQRAIDQGKITKGPGAQDNLNQITQLQEFKIILRQEVNARRLKEEDFWRNLGHKPSLLHLRRLKSQHHANSSSTSTHLELPVSCTPLLP